MAVGAPGHWPTALQRPTSAPGWDIPPKTDTYNGHVIHETTQRHGGRTKAHAYIFHEQPPAMGRIASYTYATFNLVTSRYSESEHSKVLRLQGTLPRRSLRHRFRYLRRQPSQWPILGHISRTAHYCAIIPVQPGFNEAIKVVRERYRPRA